MPKEKTIYECQNCGATQTKWAGQCATCGEWNTLVESIAVQSNKKSSFNRNNKEPAKILKLSQIESSSEDFARLEVGSSELAQVLAGEVAGQNNLGLVKGSVVLLAGEPGIGKSTILSQLTLYFATKHGKVLYACGEESVQQVKLRLDRLSAHKNTTSGAKDNILLFPETDVDAIVSAMLTHKPSLTIVDSIQTVTSGDLTGMAGSVGQVRESGNRILQAAKTHGLSTFIVGHVTKGGSIAGPKVLEHMVDTVLALEGERSSTLRLLRAMKNRFGPVDEVGVFAMTESGLTDVTNPSVAFLGDSPKGVAGSAMTVLLEGTRPILTEIQALVSTSYIPTPRRVAEGIKKSRLDVICAVLEKHAKLRLGEMDVFVNSVGGLKATEPSVDLAIALALASSIIGKPLPEKSVIMGEVGLLGEIRGITQLPKREREAKKLGYTPINVTGKSLNQIVKQLWG